MGFEPTTSCTAALHASTRPTRLLNNIANFEYLKALLDTKIEGKLLQLRWGLNHQSPGYQTLLLNWLSYAGNMEIVTFI